MKCTYFPGLFVQGEEAIPYLEYLDKHGGEKFLTYLAEYGIDYLTDQESTDRAPWGLGDRLAYREEMDPAGGELLIHVHPGGLYFSITTRHPEHDC